MYPYDDMPGGANQQFKPRPTMFGGNNTGMAGINSMVAALSNIQDRYNRQKAMRPPSQPMVNGQPWQPAPREGSQDVFQGAPQAGPQSGAPSPMSMPPAGLGPQAIAPKMPPAPPVPFMGMNGPGMGMGQDPAMASLMSPVPGGNYF
jgi:hypothetical protein